MVIARDLPRQIVDRDVLVVRNVDPRDSYPRSDRGYQLINIDLFFRHGALEAYHLVSAVGNVRAELV